MALVRFTFVHRLASSGTRAAPALIFSAAASPTGAQRLTLANLAHAEWGAEVMPNIPNEWFLDHVEVQEVSVVSHKLKPVTLATESTDDAIQGSAGTGALPPQMSVVVSLKSDTPGRSGRGRIYLPPVREADVGGDGGIAAGLVDDLQTAMGEVQATIEGGTPASNLVVVSRKDVVNYLVAQVIVRDLIHVQRRRKPQNLSA